MDRFFVSYLFAFLFFTSIALGAWFWVVVHYLSKASWSVVVRRVQEHVMAWVYWLPLLFLPILFLLPNLLYNLFITGFLIYDYSNFCFFCLHII